MRDRREKAMIEIISSILAYGIMFGVPFVIGILIGHWFW